MNTFRAFGVRRTVIFLLSLVLTGQVFCIPSVLIPGELFLTPVSRNVIVATHHFPWESNSLVIVSDLNNILLIDTPYTLAATEVLHDWIIREYRPQRIEAFVTGYHIDNLGGIGFLKEKNVLVTGTTLTNRLIREESSRTLGQLISWLDVRTQKRYRDYYSTASMVQTSREIPVEKLHTFRFDNLSIEVFYPGESHARDNTTVYIEDGNILFGSCIIKSVDSRSPGFTGDANLENWPLAVEKIGKRYPGARIVIPHHGRWGGTELFRHTRSLF